MRTCNKCGEENDDEDKFCTKCGGKLVSLATSYNGEGLPVTVKSGFIRDSLDCIFLIIIFGIIGIVLPLLYSILLILIQNIYIFLAVLIIVGGILVYFIFWLFIGLREEVRDKKRREKKKKEKESEKSQD